MEDRWAKLEEIVRRVVREEVASLAVVKKMKLGFENGRWIGITQEQIESWKAAYGAVDVDGELKKMAAWVMSNPHVAPKSQWGRFVNTWLARSQDKASLRSIPARDERQPKKACAYCSEDATGTVSGIPCCGSHTRDALDGKPRRMLNVVPKAVAGPD